MSFTNPVPRRNFLKTSAAFATFSILPSYRSLGQESPNERINLAVIGIGNQGDKNRNTFLKSGLCNVVALCDVDMEGKHTHRARYFHRLTDTAPSGKNGKPDPKGKQAPIAAKGFTDFRKMFDEMADEIDAVLIATPDHSHFSATMLAMSLGKHVYVQKPLAHTFGQCARMIEMAKRTGLVTQMGNQGFSGANYFQFKAYKEAGLMDDITRINAYMVKTRRWHGWGQDVASYPEEAMPHAIDWDTWLDSAPSNSYSAQLHPLEWRSWFEYGSGCFGDWGPHILDSSHHFLELGLPTKVSAVMREGANDFVYPQASTIRFDFPERGKLPACNVTWHDGKGNLPELEPELLEEGEQAQKVLGAAGKVLYGKDTVYQGGSHAAPLRIIPKTKFMDMRASLPKFAQKNSNHYDNFLLAIKGEETTRSPFEISGPLCQVFNLGMIAQRLGGELDFNLSSKQITNNPTANALLDPAPRKGWEQYYKL